MACLVTAVLILMLILTSNLAVLVTPERVN